MIICMLYPGLELILGLEVENIQIFHPLLAMQDCPHAFLMLVFVALQ